MAKLVIMTRSSKIISWKMARLRKTIDEISDKTDTVPSTLWPYLNTKFKDEAIILWGKRIAEDAYERQGNDTCEIPDCWSAGVESHHMISKASHPHLRYKRKNGMRLCANHHHFDPIISAEFSVSSAFNLAEALKEIDPVRWKWFMKHKKDKAYQEIDNEAEYWKLVN